MKIKGVKNATRFKGHTRNITYSSLGRAVEAKQPHPIIIDEKAIEIMEQIDYDFSKFNNQEPTQISIAIRTEILDKATKDFIEKYPTAVIINLGCGLDTRFLRVDNDKIHWYDLDLPDQSKLEDIFSMRPLDIK
ncbi:MAG: class I SAM-dependent methyltransferase [Methanobacterium sp.]